MVLPVSELQGVKVYNLSSGKSLPQWLAQAKSQRSLRYNEEFRSRIELLQDLEFPMASRCTKLSSNGQYMMVSGVYPPQIKVFDLQELSMKFERHVDSEIIQFEILSGDFSKLALLRDDRTVEFHARYGCHHKLRVPKCGRDMMYQQTTCDLYVVGSSDEAWRINLEQGRFIKGIDTGIDQINSCSVNPIHELLAFAGSNGVVEMYDPRDRHNVAKLPISIDNITPELTATEFDTDGLSFAVGTSSGHVLAYDLRSDKPIMVKDHRYGLPVHTVRFHNDARNESRKIISADKKIIKFWDRNGKAWTSIQPPADVNGLCVVPGSGLIIAGAEQPRVHTFYVPDLGPAPAWCSFLDSISEELEEEVGGAVYDDYKFLSRDEIRSLGVDHLVGSKLLKAYMHGFFMDMKLYKKVKAIANPFEYETFIKEKVSEKLKEKQQNRITLRKKLPKVNKELAEHLLKKPSIKQHIRESKEESEAFEQSVDNPLLDDRFKSMFQDPEFEIDKRSIEYKLLHPSEAATRKSVDDRFDLVLDEDEEEQMVEGVYSGSDSDEESVPVRKSSMFQLRDGMDVPDQLSQSRTFSKSLTVEERLQLQEQERIPKQVKKAEFKGKLQKVNPFKRKIRKKRR